MKKLPYFIILLLIVATPLQAQSRRNNRNNAAAKARAAAAAARAKANADAEKKAQDNYNSLHPYLPNVTVAELKGMSDADLRTLYAKSYSAQGMKMNEAKQKADAMTFK